MHVRSKIYPAIFHFELSRALILGSYLLSNPALTVLYEYHLPRVFFVRFYMQLFLR